MTLTYSTSTAPIQIVLTSLVDRIAPKSILRQNTFENALWCSDIFRFCTVICIRNGFRNEAALFAVPISKVKAFLDSFKG